MQSAITATTAIEMQTQLGINMKIKENKEAIVFMFTLVYKGARRGVCVCVDACVFYVCVCAEWGELHMWLTAICF